MLRMLIVMHNNMETGGIESYLLNTFSRINLSHFCIDIFVPGRIVSRGTSSKFEGLGCTIYEQFVSGGNAAKAIGLVQKLGSFLRTHQYDVIYVNVGNIVRQAISISLSRWYRIPYRIAHSHSAILPGGIAQRFFNCCLQRIIVRNATSLVACSKAAAMYHFGEKARGRTIIIRNGIDTQKFHFCEETRLRVRKKFGLENNCVIGHIGRFNQQKNHHFLIEIFRSIKLQDSSARLLLVGEGELENDICEKVDAYGLSGQVIFAGYTDRVEDYLCAMDMFVLPSIYEGLPLVGIEAQASGLPCIVSNAITGEAAVTDWIEFLPTSDAGLWANKILQIRSNHLRINREAAWEHVCAAGYDISNTSQAFQEILDNLI